MSGDSIGGISPAGSVSVPPLPAPASGASAGAEAFSAVLDRHISSPQSDIAAIRSEIAAIRAGYPFLARSASRAGIESASRESTSIGGLTRVPGWLQSQLVEQATGNASDPYGWRALSRTTAERVIGPGYGALFERQMQQESGFLPEVVYGMRVSTAGAEGIAQLMPQYYPHVARTDPVAGLQAGAETMRHNLNVWGGDVRRALASYNAGLGRVQSLVSAHGANWEAGLPQETRDYLAAIVGTAAPVYEGGTLRGGAGGGSGGGSAGGGSAVFGGRGPGGVLTAPLAGASATRTTGVSVEFAGTAGASVRSPSDGVVVDVAGGQVTLDHGNGWRTKLDGVIGSVEAGAAVRRSDALGVLGAGGLLRLSAAVDGRTVDPARYLLGG